MCILKTPFGEGVFYLKIKRILYKINNKVNLKIKIGLKIPA